MAAIPNGRKINAMYKYFGKAHGYLCRDCTNLRTFAQSRTWHKCTVYGDTRSEATDWKQKQTACGMYCKEYKGRTIIECLKHSERPKPDEQCEGQISLEDINAEK